MDGIKTFYMVEAGGEIVGKKFDTAGEAISYSKKMLDDMLDLEDVDIFKYDEEFVMTIKNRKQ